MCMCISTSIDRSVEPQVQQRSLQAEQDWASAEPRHHFDDGSEAPHFMTIEYAASDEAVSLPGLVRVHK